MSIRTKTAATLSALALTLGGITLAAPAHATLGVGVGTVDIYGNGTPSSCIAEGFPNGQCYGFGTGVVVNNPWSTNEVLTVWHVVENMDPTQIHIYDPYTGTTMGGYIQRHDQASDLAVLWIYDPTKPWPTAAPTFATSPMAATNPPAGITMTGWGDANQNWTQPGQLYFDNYTGTVTSNSYNCYNNQGCQFAQAGIQPYTLYNVIQFYPESHAGDSGGSVWDTTPGDPNYQTVIGLDEGYDGTYGYAIQIGWAYWDMLHTHP